MILRHGRNFVRNTQVKIYKVSGLGLIVSGIYLDSIIFQIGTPIKPATLGYFQVLIACCHTFPKSSGIRLLVILTLSRRRTLLQTETLTSN